MKSLIRVLLINEGAINYNQEIKELLLKDSSYRFDVVDIKDLDSLDSLVHRNFDMVIFNSHPLAEIDHIEYLNSLSNTFVLHSKHAHSYNCGKVLYRKNITDINKLPSDLRYCAELSKLTKGTESLSYLKDSFKRDLNFIRQYSHCGVPSRL